MGTLILLKLSVRESNNMLEISVKIEGLEEFQKLMAQMPDRVQKGLSEAIKKSIFLIEGQAKQNAPVDTGRLRASILTELHPLTASVMPTVNYAIYVHEGTRFMRGRPFLGDAVQQTQDEISDIFSEALKEVMTP